MTTPDNDISIKFFALVREQAGTDQTTEPYVSGDTIESLRQRLSQRGREFELALSGDLVMACNQTIVKGEFALSAGDEVAFFPPVTGG